MSKLRPPVDLLGRFFNLLTYKGAGWLSRVQHGLVRVLRGGLVRVWRVLVRVRRGLIRVQRGLVRVRRCLVGCGVA